jgi:hypothetical protein
LDVFIQFVDAMPRTEIIRTTNSLSSLLLFDREFDSRSFSNQIVSFQRPSARGVSLDRVHDYDALQCICFFERHFIASVGRFMSRPGLYPLIREGRCSQHNSEIQIPPDSINSRMCPVGTLSSASRRLSKPLSPERFRKINPRGITSRTTSTCPTREP